MKLEIAGAIGIAFGAFLLMTLVAMGCSDGNDLIPIEEPNTAPVVTSCAPTVDAGAPDVDTVPICPTCGTGGFGE